MSRNYLQELIQDIDDTKSKRKADASKAYDFGMELLFNSKTKFEELSKELDDADPQYAVISDLLAAEILQCGIDYFKAANQSTDFTGANALEILRSAKEIARNTEMSRRIDENIQGVDDWVNNQYLKDSQERIYNFPSIALKTAFSFMTCDGHIDANEIALIRKMALESELFGNINVEQELEFLIEVINKLGMGFLKDYFKLLQNANLSEEQELILVEVAIETLSADSKIDYNEIKFFRIFRTMLHVNDDQIREKVPSIGEAFLETDIFSKSYLDQLFDDYFQHASIPVFSKMLLKHQQEYVIPAEYKD
ncbi:MAG: TerB family tellurite resistance protein [Reichenbachiella sp.]